MSSNKRTNIVIGSVCGGVCVAGVITLLYFYKNQRKKEINSESNKDKANKNEENKKFKNNDNLVIVNRNTIIYEMVPVVSIELNKRKDDEINLEVSPSNNQMNLIQPEKKLGEKEFLEDEDWKKEKGGIVEFKKKKIKTFKEEDDKLNTSIKDKINKKLSLNNSRELEKSPIISKLNLPSNLNDTMLILNDFRDQMKIQSNKEANQDLSISLERALGPQEIQQLGGGGFDSDGYIEEDDDDNEVRYLQPGNEVKKKKHNVVSDNKPDLEKHLSNQSVNKLTYETQSRKLIRSNSLTNKISIEYDKDNLRIIKTYDELNEILNGKLKYNDMKYKMIYEEKEITLNGNELETLSILKSEHMLLILNYLYSELHAGLIELSDNFSEERRKYVYIDHETYISIINYFLRKKEEFFLCVLSDVMSKLNISQKSIDATFYFYLNVAESDEVNVQEIRNAYNKVYYAGIKYSIAPKNLTKIKLLDILKYQCDIYEKYIKDYSNYDADVIDIMVTDAVYLDYGYDREAIRAAINKININEDSDFIEILKKIGNIQNTSFLNI